MNVPEKGSINASAKTNFFQKPWPVRKEDLPLIKTGAGAVAAAVLFCAGFILGFRHEKRRSSAAVEIVNQSGHAIMTVTVRHQSGSVRAVNIKKRHKARIRFITRGPNTYSLKIILDNNKTIYSEIDRTIRNGEVIVETVTDATVFAEVR
jgi:hypothetical protein